MILIERFIQVKREKKAYAERQRFSAFRNGASCRKTYSHMGSRIVAITGGSGSGKTTLARRIQLHYGSQSVSILSQDSYYIDRSATFDGDGGCVNYDHPDAIDFKLLESHLRDLIVGESIEHPIYDFATHRRLDEAVLFHPTPIVVLDGTLILSQERLRPLFYRSIFIECPDRVRLRRRLHRDVRERGRKPRGVITQFKNHVRPMHNEFVDPSKIFADVVYAGEEIMDIDLGADERLSFQIHARGGFNLLPSLGI